MVVDIIFGERTLKLNINLPLSNSEVIFIFRKYLKLIFMKSLFWRNLNQSPFSYDKLQFWTHCVGRLNERLRFIVVPNRKTFRLLLPPPTFEKGKGF